MSNFLCLTAAAAIAALCFAAPAQAQDAATECPAAGGPVDAPHFAEANPEGYLECIEAEERLAEIQAFGGRWAACYDAEDAACLAALYDPDAVMIARDGGMPLRGVATIEAYFSGLFSVCEDEKTRAITLAYDSIDAPDDRAVIVGEWRVVIAGAEENAERTGRTMLVLRRGDDAAWRIWRQMDGAVLGPASEECPAVF